MGGGGRGHLELQVGVRQLLGFPLQRRHPQLPLLSAAGGRGPVPFQELLPALVGVLLHDPPAAPDAASRRSAAAAPARLHCMLGVSRVKGVYLVLNWRELGKIKKTTQDCDSPVAECRKNRAGGELGTIPGGEGREGSPGAAEWEAIGEPESVGGLWTGEAGGCGSPPLVAVVGWDLAAGKSLELETENAAAAGVVVVAGGGGGGGEAGAGVATGAQNGGGPLCPWRDLRRSPGC